MLWHDEVPLWPAPHSIKLGLARTKRPTGDGGNRVEPAECRKQDYPKNGKHGQSHNQTTKTTLPDIRPVKSSRPDRMAKSRLLPDITLSRRGLMNTGPRISTPGVSIGTRISACSGGRQRQKCIRLWQGRGGFTHQHMFQPIVLLRIGFEAFQHLHITLIRSRATECLGYPRVFPRFGGDSNWPGA